PSTRARPLERGVAVAIVGRALVRVFQYFVGMGDLLEHLLRLLVARILVRVVLYRLLAVGLLQFVFARGFADAQQFVIVFFGHGCVRPWPRASSPHHSTRSPPLAATTGHSGRSRCAPPGRHYLRGPSDRAGRKAIHADWRRTPRRAAKSP